MTPLERFLRAKKIKPVVLARETGIARQHLAKIRRGSMEPRRDTIAAIVSALRRLTLEQVSAHDVFALTLESGPHHAAEASPVAEHQASAAAVTFARKYFTGASDARWMAHLDARPEMTTATLVATLVLEARQDMDADVGRAAALAHFAAEVCARLPRDDARVTHLRGCAVVQYANALRHLGSYGDALAALDRAEADLSRSLTSANDLAQASYVRATVHWKQGKFDDATVAAGRAAVLFELLGDVRRLAYTRVLEASIAFEAGDAANARRLLLLVIPILTRLEDYRGLAAAWLSLGTAEGQLGNVTAAKRWLTKAGDAFQRLRVEPEMVRARWSLAYFTAIHEDREAGLKALRQAQRDFEDRRMPMEAGFVGLDLAEVLLLPPAVVAAATAVCTKLLALFRAGDVPRSAEKALALLCEATAIGRATPEFVRSVRTFMHVAERDAAATFQAPSA